MTDETVSSIDERLGALLSRMESSQKLKLLAYAETLIKERRRAKRKKHVAEVTFADDTRFGIGIIRNISLFGLYMEAEGELEAGRKVTLSFPHPTQGRQIKVTGSIIRKDKHGFAIRFSGSIGGL
jgi:S-adenosylmethionine synthetase